MFTSFSLLNSRKITPEEERELCYLMDCFSRTSQGAFLRGINYRNIQIYWCDNMQAAAGIMGAWLCWLGNRVYLMPNGTPPVLRMDRDPWLIQIAATFAHELCHVYQYKRSWWLYILACLPIVRSLTIEAEANVIFQDATKFFQTLDNLRAAQDFEKKMEKWQSESNT